MRAWRERVYVAALALLASVFIGGIWSAPAAAEELSADFKQVPAVQTLAVPITVETEDAGRDGYSITILTVVSWPSSDHDITQGQGNFGPRSCRGCSSYHEGADFNPGGGTPVAAVADGYVLQSGWSGGLGEAVTLRSEINGVTTDTVYGHMQAGSLTVTQGQVIDRGTALGLVGSTGASTGNHLHFEVHVGGVKTDPLPWLWEHVNNNDWKGLD